jgi:hypothetical protein
MKKANNDGIPSIDEYKELITKPVTERVRQINDFTLAYYAKKSILKYGFFFVLRKIEKDKIYIKLYFYKYKVMQSQRQIEDFSAAFYAYELNGLAYSCCNIMNIHIDENVKPESILSCKTMEELEKLFLDASNGRNYVGINNLKGSLDDGEGGLDVYSISFSYRSFKKWIQLLEDGYLDPDYEAKCRQELLDEFLGVKKKYPPDGTNKDHKGTVELNLFMSTGGPQPATLDNMAINSFFIGNYAKAWAMAKGYTSTFKSYEDGKIVFDMITDPRYIGNSFILSRFIAKKYKDKVWLLGNAREFQANHFYAKDIIGSIAEVNESVWIKKNGERIAKSYAGLSKEPNLIHSGIIENKR